MSDPAATDTPKTDPASTPPAVLDPPVTEEVAVEEVETPTPPLPDRHAEDDNGFKEVFRNHARWAIAEMQLAAQGKTIKERAALNP